MGGISPRPRLGLSRTQSGLSETSPSLKLGGRGRRAGGGGRGAGAGAGGRGGGGGGVLVAGRGGGRGVGRLGAYPHEEGRPVLRQAANGAGGLPGEHVVEVVARGVVAADPAVLVQVVVLVAAGYAVPVVPARRHAIPVVVVHVLADECRSVSLILQPGGYRGVL